MLGTAPVEGPLVEMVLAITRLPQSRVGSLRSEVAEQIGEGDDPHSFDRVEEECRRRVEACQRAGWLLGAVSHLDDPAGVIRSSPVLRWVCQGLVPALAATTGEIDAVLAALDGRFIPPGPSGAPSRGMAHVLPTGRNFYSVDPKAIPSPLAWQVGTALADRWSTGTCQRRVGTRRRSGWWCGGRPPCARPAMTWPRSWPSSASDRGGRTSPAASRESS